MDGSKALEPPPPSYNSEGFLGWAPATPSFFVFRSPAWLCLRAVAPFRFVFMQAPCGNLFVVVGHLLVPLSRPKGRDAEEEGKDHSPKQRSHEQQRRALTSKVEQ